MTEAERAILAELRAVSDRLAGVESELRARRRAGPKRAKSRVSSLAVAPRPVDHAPTDLDRARARRLLAR